MPRGSTPFESDEESRAFLQRRVSGFGIWAHRSALERARSERAISETDRTVAVDFAERAPA